MARKKTKKKAASKSRGRWTALVTKHLRAASKAYRARGNKKSWASLRKAAFAAAKREY